MRVQGKRKTHKAHQPTEADGVITLKVKLAEEA